MSRTKTGNLIGRAASTQKRDIREALASGMNARQKMIEEIKQMFGDAAKFNDWYNCVYKLRSAGEDKKYEQTIRRKYRYMLKKIQSQTSSPASDVMESVVELFSGREISYKNRHVKGHVCPHCGYTLTVNERMDKTTNPDRPLYTRRLTCPGYFESGCTYKEKFTPEIKALLDAEITILDSQEVDF